MNGGWRRELRLWVRQVRYQNKTFWRTPAAAFFTIVFPLMLLVIFVLVFGNDPIDEDDPGGITTGQFYAPALGVFGAVSAAFTSLAINTALARDHGILKRLRGTPLPPRIYLGGRIGSAVYLAAVAVTLMLVVGVAAFDLQVLWERVPVALLVFVLGVACWAALGLAVVGLFSSDAVPAVTNAVLLPLAFISGVFLGPADNSPEWLQTIASLFPLRHFVEPFGAAFDPFADGGVPWTSLGVLVAWTVVGMAVAVRYFRWEPRPGGGGRRRRRSHAPAAKPV